MESPLKDTKLPLGADVTVSRVVIQDFDECASDEHNDCSDQVLDINNETFSSYTL